MLSRYNKNISSIKFLEAINMQVTLTSKVKILPDEDIKNLLISTMHAYTSACNYVSAHIFSTQNTNKRSLHNDLYYELRRNYTLKSQMAESVIRTVLAKYKSQQSLHKTWTLISFNKPQCDLVWNKDYSLKEKVFSVGTLEGRKRMTFAKPSSPLTGKLGTAKLVYKHNKFYLHIPVTHEVPDIRNEDIVNIVGIDRGIRFLATCYDSNRKTLFYSGAEVKAKRAHYFELRRELERVGTSSARKRLKEIGRRENRWMRDFNHCLSKALTEHYPEGTLFVLEDLSGIRATTEKIKTRNHYINVSWPYYDFEWKLIYKASLKSQKVIKVDPAYTSQICPICGKQDKTSRDKERHIYKCKGCGYSSNDDRIAAMNLHSMGIKYLMQSDESKTLIGGAKSTSPYVTPAIQKKSVLAINAGGHPYTAG